MDPVDETTVTISSTEYEFLKYRSEVLDYLEAFGVDNWSGYGEAMKQKMIDTEQSENN